MFTRIIVLVICYMYISFTSYTWLLSFILSFVLNGYRMVCMYFDSSISRLVLFSFFGFIYGIVYKYIIFVGRIF